VANAVDLGISCSHMPFHVLVVGFNYLRHVSFSSGPLYASLVHVSDMSFHVLCDVNYVIRYFITFFCTTLTRFTASTILNLIL
jgi:hypothetical protein